MMSRHNETSHDEHRYMRLGVIEFLAMNNPIRRWIQKHIEYRHFKKHLGKQDIDLAGGVIMDAGCGSGYSTEFLAKAYHPSRLIAFDYMPEQIRLAKKRKLDVDFAIGDLRDIQSDDATCDAVFIFGVIHHIVQWQEALYEVARVLKPGGVLLLDEPKYGFTWEELESELRNVGLDILETSSFFFKLFHTYLCRKPPNQSTEKRA
ncbi:class I SAM-dependent methyltransferase [Planctomycetota bacterium]